MRLIYSRQDDAPAELDGVGLADLYRYPAAPGEGGPWVRANFVSTLDGAATGPDGRTGSINTRADREVFALLRGLADVILVGAGTARAERYEPPEPDSSWERLGLRSGRSPVPPIAVVTRSGDLPPLLERQAGEAEILLVTCATAPRQAVELARTTLGAENVLVYGEARADLGAVVRALADRGMPRVLCEGGPHLMHDLVGAGALDELCLTTSPMIVGGAHPRIVEGSALMSGLRLDTLVEADGSLLGRWLAADHAPNPS